MPLWMSLRNVKDLYSVNPFFLVYSLQSLIFSFSLQSYTTNSAKVIFLHQRPQTRNFKGSGKFCSTCDRSLQDPYLFCSLSCKVSFALKPESSLPHAFSILLHSYINFSHLGLSILTLPQFFHFFSSGFVSFLTISSFFLFFFFGSQINFLIRTKGGISEYLFDCKTLSLPEPGLDDGFMTPDSVLEPAGSSRTSSGSGGCSGVDCRTVACTATTEIVRKKRSSLSSAYRAVCRPVCSPVSEISASLMNRRKGTPQRAPLY